MVKSIKLAGLFVFACLFLTFCLRIDKVKADVGEFPSPGGTITPGDKTDSIAMKSEDVYFDVKKNDDNTAFGFVVPEYYAHVTATFTMNNLTDQQQDQKLFFPFYTYSPYGDMQQANNANVTINDQPVDLTYVDSIFTNDQTSVAAAVFNASFTPNSDTTITVNYDIRVVNYAKSSDLVFEYMMETGSHWAGNIEHGKVTFNFPWQVSSTAPFANVNDFFTAQDGKLVWEFNNLEPDATKNIEVAFNPQVMKTWENRPGIIKNISASTMQGRFYQAENIRTGNDYPGGFVSSSAVNLLDYANDDDGWLVNQKSEAFDEWVQFNFDATYTVEELQIRTGFLSKSYDEADGSEADYYDTYRHPKTMIITYSDGSTQEIDLQNQPAEYQSIKLNNTPTTSIKLSFTNAYPGVGGGNDAFAVGRIKFANATIVETAQNQQTQDATTESPKLADYQLYLIGGAVVFIVITGTTAWFIKRKKATKLKISTKNTGESATLPDQPKKMPKD
ncbi:MAG: hypothetical protein PVI21_01985 [Candidatus Woesebacteria bacterium]|jgi:hypothetical protein